MLEEVLFIGGLKDGQRIAVPENRNDYTAEIPSSFCEMLGVYKLPNLQHYRRLRITVGKLTISVFVAGLITDEMALKMLVDGYCKEDFK